MKNANQFNGMKILVLGLRKVAMQRQLYCMRWCHVTVNDASPEEGNEEAAELRSKGIRVICGGHPAGILDEGFELVVKNPGIPYSNPVVVEAIEKGIPVWTEIELASRISEAPIVGITGSNGKTTTTTLLYHMLNIGNKHPLIAGNIGTVSCTVAEKATNENIIVLRGIVLPINGDRYVPT